MLLSWEPCGYFEEPKSQRSWSSKPRLHGMRSLHVYGWDPPRPIPAARSVQEYFGVRAGRETVHRYARLPGSCVAKDPEATGSCRVHFEASDRVRQRRLGTFTSQGQETHRTRTGYPGAHRGLLAKNGRTVLRTQRRLLVLCASTRQVGIRHHRKVRGRRSGGEGVVGTLGSRAGLGHFRHTWGHGHPGRSWDVSSRLVGLDQAVRQNRTWGSRDASAWHDAGVGDPGTRAL